MPSVSPVDVISPAFRRARTLLYPPGPDPGTNAPFRFWFFLKIVSVAALTQGNIYFALFVVGGEFAAVLVALISGISGAAVHRNGPLAPAGGLTPAMVAALLVVLFCALFAALLFTWLWCRLRFTLFDLVLYRHGRVARAWSAYRSRTWPFVGLVMSISLGLLLLLAVTAGPLILRLVGTVRHVPQQQLNSDPTFIFTYVLPLYGLVFAMVLLAGAANAIAQDFILPPMALEDAPLGVAFSRFFQLLRTRFWYVALYLLFRYLLELGIGMVGGMVLFLVILIFGGGGAAVGFVLYRTLWHSGGAALFVAFCVFAGLLFFALYTLLTLVLYGYIAIVKQCYAVCFDSQYYPPLADRLGPLGPNPAAPSEPTL